MTALFSSEGFRFLVLALRSLTYLELIFVYGARRGSGPLFGMWVSHSPGDIW